MNYTICCDDFDKMSLVEWKTLSFFKHQNFQQIIHQWINELSHQYDISAGSHTSITCIDCLCGTTFDSFFIAWIITSLTTCNVRWYLFHFHWQAIFQQSHISSDSLFSFNDPSPPKSIFFVFVMFPPFHTQRILQQPVSSIRYLSSTSFQWYNECKQIKCIVHKPANKWFLLFYRCCSQRPIQCSQQALQLTAKFEMQD